MNAEEAGRTSARSRIVDVIVPGWLETALTPGVDC